MQVTSEPSETLVWSSAASELIVNPPSIDMASKGEADSRQFTMTTDLTRCPTLKDYTSSTPLNNSLNDATPLRPSKKRKQNSSDVTHTDDQFMKVLADVHKVWKNMVEVNAPLDPITESVKGFVRILNDRHPHLKAKFVQKVSQALAEISQEFH